MRMNEEENKKDLSFESLVKAINEKWGHTYLDVFDEEIVIPEYELNSGLKGNRDEYE